MQVPLLDLTEQFKSIQQEVLQAVTEVFDSQHFILGPQVAALEKELAEYCRAPFGTAVSSGTDALLLALMAEKIGAGDEVIAPPFTFFATAGSISRLGAKPVFADVLPETFNIDPAQIEAKITSRTKAIMPVHLFGQMADMESVMNIAKKYNLIVIEDAAQAVGAERNGKKAGSIGDYGCFSFFPSKNLGGAGDGGFMTARDKNKYDRLMLLRNHGAHPKYFHAEVGGNFRLDALQAAVVRIKLKHLDKWNQARRANAAFYNQLFSELKISSETLTAPQITDGHIVNQYVVRVQKRDALRDFLKQNGIDTEIYYPLPLHSQECFRDLGYKAGSMPVSEKAAKEVLALPVFPELKKEQIAYVADSIARFYRQGS